MTSNIQPQKPRILILKNNNNINKKYETSEHRFFLTEYELETHVSRFFQKIARENTLPEEPEIITIEAIEKGIPRIPKKKA